MSLAANGYVVTGKSNEASWNANEYKILHEGSGGGTFARDSSQATMSYLCEYYYVERFIDAVLGKTGKVGGSLVRSTAPFGSLPDEHPYFYNFFASSAEVTPKGKSYNDADDEGVYPLWNKAIVNVVYRPPTYNVRGDDEIGTELERFVTKTPEADADIQTALGFFKFVSDPAHRPLDTSPGYVVPSVRINYTWHQIPTLGADLGTVPNIDTILSLAGTVNAYAFDGYAPGTVLFMPGPCKLIQPQVATNNNYYWDIGYIFSIRDYGISSTPYVPGERIGWNYAYDPVRGVWDLYTAGAGAGTTSGDTNYVYADLNELFEVTW